MIKILFFIDTLQGGGAAKVLLDLVNAMDKSKFEITVQTIFREGAAEKIAPGVRYQYSYKADDKLHRALMRMESALGMVYKNHIADTYDIECAYLESLSTKIMATSTNKTALKCAWVHCDLEKMAGDIVSYLAKTKPWYDAFDQIICVSERIKTCVDRLYENRYQTKVLYNTIDDMRIRENAAQPLPGGCIQKKKTLVTVGTLYPPKNQLRLLRTVKRLKEDGVELGLWILGDGSDRSTLEQYITENRLQENVQLLGFCENPYPYIAAADVAVCSSNYEGFSTFITEGLILGKPIVTTECSGMRELLGDSEYGLITENEDEAFYQGLKQMLTQPGLLEHYREMADVRGKDFRQQTLVQATEAFLGNTWKARWGK